MMRFLLLFMWLLVLGTTSAATLFANGLQESRTLPNGSYTLYDYNNVGALSSLINKKSDGTVRSTFDEFGYDGVFNNLGFDADYASSTDYTGTKAYEYDTKDRLTSEARSGSGPFSFTFAYDAAGNPTTFKGASRTYNIDNQRTSSSSYVYDGNGNPTTYAGSTLAYDRENRLTSAPSLTAGYRADGLRAYKGSGTDRRYYLYDGGNVVCELLADGSVASFNDYAPDGLVARMDEPVEVGGDDCTSNRGGSLSSADIAGETYFLFDPQGSVAHRLGTSEGVLANSHYDAYGVESADTTVYDPFGYNAKHGYTLDRETGLYLCQHRYYDPGTGRWLTRDPIGFGGGLNLYGYCGGGPVGAVDRSGYRPDVAADVAVMGFLDGGSEAAADAALARLAGVVEEGLEIGIDLLPGQLGNSDEPEISPDCEPGTGEEPAIGPIEEPGPDVEQPTLPHTNPNPVPFPSPDNVPPDYELLKGGRHFRGPKGDTLSPDPDHGLPKGPHWDYWPPGIRPSTGSPLKVPLKPGETGWPPIDGSWNRRY